MENKMQELLTNEEFMSKVAKSKTENEVKNLFASEGVELNESQIKELKNLFIEVAKELNELDSEELDKAAGGRVEIKDFKNKQTLIGALIGGVAGSAAGYKAIKTDDKMSKKVIKVLGSAVVGATTGVVGGAATNHFWNKRGGSGTVEVIASLTGE
ncbi:MAG: hypothetical protein LBK29_01750 [Oscillospiraceae bacterium]|jgi:hypothetical protein|nr:hypothetical protein [Oscillospiraceae bacterium]